jgi:hypothetical protein
MATGNACGSPYFPISSRRVSIRSFAQENPRIRILSNNGRPTAIPRSWGPILEDSDVLVCIPDMHMFLYDSPLDSFRNSASAMLDLLAYLEQVQKDLLSEGRNLRVLQLGDMFELCFPHPEGGKVTVHDIRHSHRDYQEIINAFRRLDTTFIEGNHDFWYHKLRRSPDVVCDGRVRIEHGFAADNWYYFANPYRPGWRPAVAALRWARGVQARAHRLKPQRLPFVRRRIEISRLLPQRDGDSRMPDPRHYPRRQFAYFSRLLQSQDPASRPRICVVAHTHHPMISSSWAQGECLLVDAGVWTGGRTDFAIITNSEVAVCRYASEQQSRLPSQLKLAV